VAKEAGQFRLEIRAEGQATIRGHYELTSQLKTTPDSTDTERLAAEQLLVEANDLERSGSKEALQMAIDKRAATLPIWRKLADRFWEAYSLHYSGRAA
jgi:antitoxin component HigA of HigAB toxin-antitoxin module